MSVTPNLRLWSVISNASSIIYGFAKADTKKKEVLTFYKFEQTVVREFVKDVEDNPCIYKGLPLHTEYRIFVDFDTKDILGISPYWEPETMKKAFSRDDDIHNKHDYITYSMHEKTLMDRYHKNKDDVLKKIEQLISQTEHLTGQWSIDVMQNGEDFYLIDMALAAQSALKECVPEHLLAPVRENWIPDFSQMEREDLER